MSLTSGSQPDAAVRTALSWNRTVLALLANAALLLVRNPLAGAYGVVLAGAALVLAVAAALLNSSRERALATQPTAHGRRTGVAVLALGIGVALLATAVGVGVVLD